ncbi:MAG: ACT domain-containing protein [Oscillospiraceae bacterium]|nr:ACT domain-containing protein [Oscillospiraceae bacterium]
MYGITKIQAFEDITLVSFHGIPPDLPLLGEIFTGFADAGINIDMISQTAPLGGSVSISFTCGDTDMVKVLAIAKDLQEKYPDFKPLVTSGNAKVQLYGEEMRETPGVFARLLRCMSGIGVQIMQVTTSEVDISMLVDPAHLGQVLSVVNDAYGIA